MEIKKEDFRNYTDSERQQLVQNHYKLMRQNQTVEYVEKMEQKYFSFDKAKMTIWQVFNKIEQYVDSSDPDISLPNIEHMFQTAEAIRKAGHPDWFQLVGLIHDLGKIMFLWGTEEDGQNGSENGSQWGLGGDTWVVGCRIPDTIILPEYNILNPDMSHPVYKTKNGIYKEKCGFDNLKFTFGHDEYMYRMLVHNKCKIPKEGLEVIRYHSCYVWHTRGAYQELMNKEDLKTLFWVLEFNKFDLYTKKDDRPNIKELTPYYQRLIEKYFPNQILEW